MAESSPYADLLTQQKKERKELIAKTQKMKHGIPKGDKKQKKEVTAEIAQMIAALDLKHEEELKEFEVLISSEDSSNLTGITLQLNSVSKTCEQEAELEEFSEQTFCTSDQKSSQRLSKAQKRRNKKAQQEREREIAINKQEKENLSGKRFLESAELTKILSSRQMVIHQVPSDGDCLFKAVEHQLSFHSLEKLTAKDLRQMTADYLLSHKDDYIPFLTNSRTGDMLTDYEFVEYCDEIKNTSAWGGHVEVQILAKICGKPIEVIQAKGPSIIAGDETLYPRLILSYHKHAYGLGEHYNSVIPV